MALFGLIGDPSQADPSQAGLAGVLGTGPQQGLLGGGNPNLSILSAALQDAGDYFGGHPADANNLNQQVGLQRQYALQRSKMSAVQAMNSADPNVRQQGYQAYMMLGGDPRAFQQMQAAKAMPQLLQNMTQGQDQTVTLPGGSSDPLAPQTIPSVGSLGRMTAPSITTNPGTLNVPSLPITGNSGPMGLIPALAATGSPELSEQMAEPVIKNQMDIANKSLRPASAAQKTAGGYGPNDPVMTDIYGNLTSPVKPQAAVQQTYDIARNTPRSQEDIAKDSIAARSADAAMITATKPQIVPIGATLMGRGGQPVGGQGGMPVAGGNLSSNINDYPAQTQSMIRGMLNGTIAPPQGAALRSPQMQQMVAAAAAIDPSFDETKWFARNKMASDAMGNGAWGKSMNALGTATQHVAALGNYGANTASTTIPALNWGLNKGASAFGGAGPSVYQDTAHKVGEEYTRAYRGAGGSEADIQSSMDALSPNASSAQKNAVIDENMNLARDKMAENVQQYNRTMGTNKKISDFVSPQTVAAYKSRGIDIDAGSPIGQGGGGSQLAPAASPQDIVNELRKRGVVK